MTTPTSRNERRLLRARATKLYGIKGDYALLMQDAYHAHAEGNLSEAARLAQKVSTGYAQSVHPWLLLGTIAVERMEGETALVFFSRAAEIMPQDARVIGGKGKAQFLLADAFGAVDTLKKAIIAGSKDIGVARIYNDLAARIGRFSEGGSVLEIMAKRLSNADLWYLAAEMYIGVEDLTNAAKAFTKAYDLDPGVRTHRIGQAKALIFSHQFARAETQLDSLDAEFPQTDELITLRMMVLRNLGRWEEALALLGHPFEQAFHYQQALAQAAYICMDKQDHVLAERYLRQAVHVDNLGQQVARKSLATYLFLKGDFQAGAALFGARNHAGTGQTATELAGVIKDASHQDALYIRSEQGIGDQLALLPLTAVFGNRPPDSRPMFLGEARLELVLTSSDLPIRFMPEEKLSGIVGDLDAGQVCFLGDLVGIATDQIGTLKGYARPPDTDVRKIRERYERLAAGRPVFGLAWKSRECLTGYHRSIPLERLVNVLPRNAYVVSLQYGDCQKDIAAARAVRPDVTVFEDRDINQMTDLMTFLAQIKALAHVMTIDNTTAHACGALGHDSAHVLLPAGAECMWYWGMQETVDPWYGCLNLLRQKQAQNWDHPLEILTALYRDSDRTSAD